MNILITGATGFVGVALTRRLLSLGNHCRCLVRNRENAESLFGQSSNIEYWVGDLNDSNSLENVSKNIDVVYHLAAEGSETIRSKGFEERIFQTNVRGTENLLRQCLSQSALKFIHFSSTSAMGPSDIELADENTVCRPVTPYQKSKLEGEELVIRYWIEHQLSAVILRPCPIYGPGGKGRLYDITRLIKRGLFPKLGKTKISLCMVDVRDVVRAALLVESKGRLGDVYIISSDNAYDLELIRKLILEYLGLKRPYLYMPVTLAKAVAFLIEKTADITKTRSLLRVKDVEAAIAQGSFSIEKAKNLLGFFPEIDLKSGIWDTLQWYQENRLI